MKPMSHYRTDCGCDRCGQYRDCYIQHLRFHSALGCVCGVIGYLVALLLLR